MSTAWDETMVREILMNPVYAINISDELAGDHPVLISRQDWIDANERLIGEIGARAWLAGLLNILEGSTLL